MHVKAYQIFTKKVYLPKEIYQWKFKKAKLNESLTISLREKCPYSEFFLVCIFRYSDWIRTRKTQNMDNFHAVLL